MLFKISGVHPMYMLPLVVIALLFLDEAMSSVKHHQPVPASPVILDSPAYASSYSSSDVLEEELEASVPPETADEDSSPAEGEIPAWYSADAKYLLFQPSGGISNQRKILEWALRVCEILQRTCILPHVAPHTTWYYKYNEVPLTDLAAADLVYSVEDMPVPVVTLAGQTMHQFARGHESRLGGAWRVVDRSSLRDKRANPWNAEEVSRQYGDEAAQFLYLSKGTMWQCFNFSAQEMEPIQKRVRFHADLRHAARDLSLTLGPNGVYNALHIRFADGEANKVRESWLKPSSTFLYRMKLARFQDTSPNLYIATVPSKVDSPFFAKFKAVYNVAFFTALPQRIPALDPFPPAMQSTALGIIEQLLCTRAQKFLGTGFSTFSEHIRTMRRYRVIAQDPQAADSPLEAEFMSKVTLCLHETRTC